MRRPRAEPGDDRGPITSRCPGTTFDGITTHNSRFAAFHTLIPPLTLQASVDATRIRLTAVPEAGPNSAQLAALAAPAPAAKPTPAAPKKFTTQLKPPTKSNAAPLIDWHAPGPKAKQAAPVPRAALQHPAWVRDLVLHLGTPDPNHDIRIAPPLAAPRTGRR